MLRTYPLRQLAVLMHRRTEAGRLLGTMKGQSVFLHTLLRASMQKYLESEPVPIPPMRQKVRWVWFVVGCFFLMVGSAYLYNVEISVSVDATDKVWTEGKHTL